MDIDAFTCCLGPVYAGYLERSLPQWMPSLDSLTVVTAPQDAATQTVCRQSPHHPKIRVVCTDVFRRYGASLNKGAALAVAYAAMDPLDAVLHFDADILPPPNWRAVVEKHYRPNYLFGCRRCDEGGRDIPDAPPLPYGFFQLWSAADARCHAWPTFEVWHPHCGNYDMAHHERWPLNRRAALPMTLTHYGEPRQNWFGAGLPQVEQAASYKQMLGLHYTGLRRARLEAQNNPAARLQLPEPILRLAIAHGTPAHQWQLLRACYGADPFLVQARVGTCPLGWEVLGPHTQPDDLRRRVESLGTPCPGLSVAQTKKPTTA